MDVHSSNLDAKLAKIDDVITMSFTGMEPMQTPNVSFSGHVATVEGSRPGCLPPTRTRTRL